MRIIEHFYGLLAPHDCIICGSEGNLICSNCSARHLFPVPSRCYRCNKVSDKSSTCPTCRQYSVLKYVWVRTGYNEMTKQLVHALKFKFAKDVAKTIARELAAIIPELSSETIIVHVPAATTHVRQRGFDQSAVIARELSKLTGLRHVHALGRLGQQRQVGATSQVRLKQMSEAFRSISSVVKGANILLVDDVLTTGATLESAALALRGAGAKSVSAVVFAQAI